jgi:hypothetical protein
VAKLGDVRADRTQTRHKGDVNLWWKRLPWLTWKTTARRPLRPPASAAGERW